ncbi:metal-dependent hydrolase [Alkalihalophilus pseudofirmus]|uniref:metal-dependent hydrolase n=1 Tax=Alkalihalophilus TaxID=2893060 RepID=UPI00095364F6|nr:MULTISPECIES: metal-dependent hydrolase [Alkalihalophilus]MED1600277.1 metal-dependent hydrolase [Alkalihalophilus marmarensis]OLS39757.1 metal-dependent hydrolase [Alkalihalophilus pseudofirmus]WEG16220.1 metal-dependent hydrolase [Alkalihalophilus pseudofirmus]
MKVSYHGHSVVQVEANGKKIIIDPFISGNELTDLDADKLEVDVILLTHGHNDHVGDTVELAKRNDALVVAPFELATYLGWKGVKVHPMHIGGAHTFDFGTVKLTQAFHGSAYTDEEKQEIIYTGMPAGILLTAEGKTIYHAGDTALFSDMKLIGERNMIDLAFIPIGDNFTMGPEDASVAAEWLQAKQVVPIHFNTFPVIEQDAHEFADNLSGKKGKVLEVGESMDV